MYTPRCGQTTMCPFKCHKTMYYNRWILLWVCLKMVPQTGRSPSSFPFNQQKRVPFSKGKPKGRLILDLTNGTPGVSFRRPRSQLPPFLETSAKRALFAVQYVACKGASSSGQNSWEKRGTPAHRTCKACQPVLLQTASVFKGSLVSTGKWIHS